MNSIKRILLAFAVGFYYSSLAQEIDNQLWLNYSIKFKTNTKFSYGGDAGVRGVWSNYDWNQFLIRPTVNYKFNKTLSGALAVAMFSTFNKSYSNLLEFRIHQDINAEWPQTKYFSVFLFITGLLLIVRSVSQLIPA